MLMQTYLVRSRQALREATWRQIVLGVSLGLNVVLGVASWTRDIVIHLPPAANTAELVIAERDANQETKIAHGLYLAGLLGNVSPHNAGFLESLASRFVTPRAFRSYLGALREQAAKFRDEQLTTTFQAMEATYDPGTDFVSVTGLLVTRGVTESERRDYRTFRFRFVTRQHQTLLDELQVTDEHTRLAAVR